MSRVALLPVGRLGAGPTQPDAGNDLSDCHGEEAEVPFDRATAVVRTG